MNVLKRKASGQCLAIVIVIIIIIIIIIIITALT
jgi:hypothetical protein